MTQMPHGVVVAGMAADLWPRLKAAGAAGRPRSHICGIGDNLRPRSLLIRRIHFSARQRESGVEVMALVHKEEFDPLGERQRTEIRVPAHARPLIVRERAEPGRELRAALVESLHDFANGQPFPARPLVILFRAVGGQCGAVFGEHPFDAREIDLVHPGDVRQVLQRRPAARLRLHAQFIVSARADNRPNRSVLGVEPSEQSIVANFDNLPFG